MSDTMLQWNRNKQHIQDISIKRVEMKLSYQSKSGRQERKVGSHNNWLNCLPFCSKNVQTTCLR